ncbi:MAG: hypothetical protein LLG04_14825 [Parachlamydia sp.]|nr:hypothetical protein [Parachlamydia sp.]
MESYTIALFGEAEKGEYCTGYLCNSLAELVDYFGNPPNESLGLHLAVQGLLYHRHVLFFRVEEEGYSEQDYLLGLNLLAQQRKVPHIEAIGIPGVGSSRIIEAATPICQIYHSILLVTEADLFDYLTQAA